MSRLKAICNLGLLIAGLPALAQSPLERFERQVEQISRQNLRGNDSGLSVDRRVFFDYGAYLSLSYFSIDDDQGKNHVLKQYDAFAYARLNLDDAQELFIRGHAGYRDFNKGDSFDGRGDEPIDPDVDRAYYRFDLAKYIVANGQKTPGYNLIFQGGRDLSYWANGLVLAQVLDGASLSATWGSLQLDLVAGVTPTRTLDFDSSRPNFDHNTTRGFFGAMLAARVGAHRPFLYLLTQRDWNKDDFAVFGNNTPTKFNYNSTYLGFGSTGSLGDRLVYGVEAALEGGRDLSNSFGLREFDIRPVQGLVTVLRPEAIEQKHQLIQAYAADIRLDYVLIDPRKTRLSAELTLASGDTDRRSTTNTLGGNRRYTDDHAFNGFGLINTSQAFAPPVSNLLAMRLGISTFPFPQGDPWDRLQLGGDFFIFGKYRQNAPLDEATDGGQRYLGVEPDLFLNWQVANDVTVALRYGLFFPGSGLVANDPRQFFFLGVTYAF